MPGDRGTVLFVWRRTPPPFLIGGAEVSQQLLAEEFVAAGWNVTYLGSHEAPWNGVSDLSAMRRHLADDGIDHAYHEHNGELLYDFHGIRCVAVLQARLETVLNSVLRSEEPMLVICSQEGADELVATARKHTTVAGWLHSASVTGMNVLKGQPDHVLATSRFVKDRVPGRSVLFYPPFREPPASGRPTPQGDILMINPVPAKGSWLIHQLAVRLPDRHFTLIEGWWNTAAEFADHPNVTYLPRTYDMDPIYRNHRLLLVPSICDDAFPRVITEAALHYIPAIGSIRGGIPEAIGDPRRLLEPDDIESWVERITSMDPSNLTVVGQETSEHARQFSRSRLSELATHSVLPG